jgi:hypothetical protein
MTSPADVAKLLRDALDTQPTIISQPNDESLLALKEKLLDILQTISYDRADGFHHVVGVMQTEPAYMADHNGTAFPIPKCLGLWDDKIAKDATVVKIKKTVAGSRRVLATAVDDWSENLLALAPVQAYAYVQ